MSISRGPGWSRTRWDRLQPPMTLIEISSYWKWMNIYWSLSHYCNSGGLLSGSCRTDDCLWSDCSVVWLLTHFDDFIRYSEVTVIQKLLKYKFVGYGHNSWVDYWRNQEKHTIDSHGCVFQCPNATQTYQACRETSNKSGHFVLIPAPCWLKREEADKTVHVHWLLRKELQTRKWSLVFLELSSVTEDESKLNLTRHAALDTIIKTWCTCQPSVPSAES